MSFLNKVVIITGAGSGIGEGTAVHFATLSANLSLIDKNGESLHKVAEKCGSLSQTKVLEFHADVSNDEEIKQAVDNTMKEFGKIDVVVNCAGIIAYRGILDSDLLSVFDKVISVNLRSMVAMTHFAAPALIESKGCVVNISSVMARMVSKGSLPYNVSKAAVAHFTKNAAYDLAEKGVRVNSILPGPVETNILLSAGNTNEENDKLWELFATAVPLQHNINACEIAEMVAYLASDKAKSITGAEFVVDSGMILSGMPNAPK
ncbi:jg16361 [Pararge aegeria aegeria]|uniref:Jg16361 protein n=1 Tax=Pararge aegeria aegeria TaxID=348720 RepID=A0A8S4QTH6_9NEOP|nr:jg16361 [Pararge aegeria aegeria]